MTTKLGSDSGTPRNLKIEHATGYLKVSPAGGTLAAPVVSTNLAEHDDNSVASETGYTGSVIKPILIQNSSGRVRCVPV